MSGNKHVSVSQRKTSTFLGADHHVLLGAENTDGLVGVVDIQVQPGSGAPLHTNNREALVWYGIEGTLVLHTEDGRSELAAGDAMFLPQGSTHSAMNLSDHPARALLLCLPGGFEQFFLELSGKLPTTVPAGPSVPDVLETLATTATRYDVVLHATAPV